MKILLVDDSRTMRTIQRRVLEGLGAGTEFFEAADGFEALSVIASLNGHFDLGLIDWNMPNMD
ncbi:MAG TPA: response regulator, partial [Humisphaera sp.]